MPIDQLEQPNQQEWVILESMGHGRVAGVYYFENGLHRVDIPDVSPEAEQGRFIRTERYGSNAIFRITPVTEVTARLVARQCVIPDAIPWDVRHELKQLAAPNEPVELMAGDEDDFFEQLEDEDPDQV